PYVCSSYLFFFLDVATSNEVYSLSLHDALPISDEPSDSGAVTPSTGMVERPAEIANRRAASVGTDRSAEPDRPIGRGPSVPAPDGSCVTRSPCSEKDTA